MLKEMTIEGIKSFKEVTTIPFAPITVLTGTNSSGKSSIFQSLLVLKQSFESPSSQVAGLHLNGKYISLGSFEDWSSDHKSSPIQVKVTLGQMPALTEAFSSPTSSGSRFALASAGRSMRYWWRSSWRSRYTLSAVRAGGTLELGLVPSEQSATTATLQSFAWCSWGQIEGGAKDTYRLGLTRNAEVDNSGEMKSLPGDDLTDTDELCYALEIDYNWQTSEPESDVSRGLNLPNHETTKAAIEGLLPISFLKKTEELAVYQTLTSALKLCVNEIQRVYSAKHNERTRSNLENLVPSRNSLPSSLKETIEFLETCVPGEFLTYLKNFPEIAYFTTICSDPERLKKKWQLEKWHVRFRGLPIMPPGLQRDRYFLQIAKLQLDRLCDLLVDAYEIDHDLIAGLNADSDFGDLQIAVPGSAKYLDIIRFLMETSENQELKERLRKLVKRAVVEANEKRFGENLLPAGLLMESLVRSPRDGSLCPTEQQLRSFFVDLLYHLGPLRDEPKNLYTSDLPSSIADVGNRGERAIACLRYFGETEILAPSVGKFPPALERCKFYTAVEEWGRYLGIYNGIVLDESMKYGTVCKVAVSSGQKAVHSDLTNVGVGVSQLLPVIVLCLAVPVGSVVLIEQPELHLHPAVQSRLSEFFVACALTGRQVVVETHSEHLVNGLRLMASDGRLQPERDVSLAFIEKDDYGSEVTRIAIGSDGGMDRWPTNFFDEAERVLVQIIKNKLTR